MKIDHRQLEGCGYLLATAVRERDLIGLVEALGDIRVDARSPELVREIRPQPLEEAKRNTLSSRYGTEAFPFHTDTAHWEKPARYLALYCVDPGEGQRPTLLQDMRAWRLEDAEVELATSALWAVGHIRPRIHALAAPANGFLSVRYDMDCMRPLTAPAQRLKELIAARVEHAEKKQIRWEPRQLLIIDNYRMLHARGKALNNDPGRVLKRILIGGG